MDNKYQHFVPKFYLRNFSNNGKSIGSYVFSNHKYIADAPIRKICGRDYLYGEDLEIEKWFANLEGIWATIIKRIINESTLSINDEEYTYLLMLIYLSEARTGFHADTFVDFQEKQFHEYLRLYREHGRIRLSDEEINNLSVKVEKPNLTSIKAMPEIVEVMSDLVLVLLKNTTRRQFITSDCPVVKYNSLFVERHYYRSYGYGQVGAQCFFPISSSLCLALIDAVVYDFDCDKEGVIKINAPDQIIELNKLFVKNAKQAIYFNNSERKWIIEKMVQNRKDTSKEFGNYEFGNEKTGFLLMYSAKSVFDLVKIPVFKTRDNFLKMPLPLHSAGPLRPNAEKSLPKSDVFPNRRREVFYKER